MKHSSLVLNEYYYLFDQNFSTSDGIELTNDRFEEMLNTSLFMGDNLKE
jgi:hypothetical protein